MDKYEKKLIIFLYNIRQRGKLFISLNISLQPNVMLLDELFIWWSMQHYTKVIQFEAMEKDLLYKHL